MQRQARKVSAWWASSILGFAITVLSESFSWSSPHPRLLVPSLGDGTIVPFIHRNGSDRPDDQRQLVIGRQEDRQGEIERWESLPPQERQEMQRRMDRWRELSPQDQQLYRKRYRQWQELAPEERQRMKENLRDWDSLSPSEKERIRKRFQAP